MNTRADSVIPMVSAARRWPPRHHPSSWLSPHPGLLDRLNATPVCADALMEFVEAWVAAFTGGQLHTGHPASHGIADTTSLAVRSRAGGLIRLVLAGQLPGAVMNTNNGNLVLKESAFHAAALAPLVELEPGIGFAPADFARVVHDLGF